MAQTSKAGLIVFLLLLCSFIVNLGFSAFMPVFPYLVLAIKGVLKELPELSMEVRAYAGAIEFGALMAVFMAARAPTAFSSGFLSDFLGRRRMMVIGLILYFASSLGFVFSNTIPELLLFRALQGIASGMVWPVAEAYLADTTRRWQRGKALSSYVASMLIAELVGPSIGVAIYKGWVAIYGPGDYLMALKSPAIFLAILSLASALTIFLIPDIGSRVRSGQMFKQGFKQVSSILRSLPPAISRSLKVMYFNGVANGFALGILQTAQAIYVIQYISKDPAFLGILFTVFAASALPTTLLSGYISDRIKRRKPLVVMGYVVGRGALFIIPFIRDPVSFLALVIPMSATFGFSMPVMRALQADLTPRHVRGTIFGLQQFFFNGGVFAGAILGGLLMRFLTPNYYRILGLILEGVVIPFWLTGFIGALTTILFVFYVIEPGI